MQATVKKGATVLIGEDELEVRAYLQMALKCIGHPVEVAQDGEEVMSCLRSGRSEFGAVVLDVMMPRKNGLETLREIRAMDPTLPVIMISGLMSPTNIVTAMKAGATDFLCKPVAHEDLRKAICRAMEARVLEPGAPVRKSAATNGGMFRSVNPQMREIESLVRQISWAEAPVLIQGETGTGKEVLARELHANSPRANKPFLKLNCAALPFELVESELFGYERGAFTGAFQKKAGMFELANGGTILLDEIGDMDVRLQAKLLQVLQDFEFQRIGGKEMIRVDVRVMAATHRDLEMRITEHSFREDLYYRLNVVTLHLPPLRDRKDDVVPLAELFLRKHAVQGIPAPELTAEVKDALASYHWPGNIRELENTMRRFLIVANPNSLIRELRAKSSRKSAIFAVAATAPPIVHAPAAANTKDLSVLEDVVKAKQHAEADAILAALNSTHWNRKTAAVLLNIDYKALLYKLKKLGIEGKLSGARKDQQQRYAATA